MVFIDFMKWIQYGKQTDKHRDKQLQTYTDTGEGQDADSKQGSKTQKRNEMLSILLHFIHRKSTVCQSLFITFPSLFLPEGLPFGCFLSRTGGLVRHRGRSD